MTDGPIANPADEVVPGEETQGAAGARRPYVAPCIEVIGTVASLTRSPSKGHALPTDNGYGSK